MMQDSESNPLLRPLDFQRVFYRGQPMWFLRDPLQLSEKQLFMPEAMAPLLTLLDGQRTVTEIHALFSRMVGEVLDPKITREAIEHLDDALLLDNENSVRARTSILDTFRAQPFRTPALAGSSYPADPADLSLYLQGFASGAVDKPWFGRGIVSPHIDYERGGRVYSQVWGAAEGAVLEADLVIVLGTDHYGGLGTITLTKQPYATPYGILPADEVLIDHLAGAVGEEAAYADELNHRHEHSVELSAVWLHHIFARAGKEPCPMLPVLVGSFQHFLDNGADPAVDERYASFLNTLLDNTNGKRVLVVASVDLAHVGPAFGDNFTMDAPRREALAEEDSSLMAAAISGDAASWYSRIAAVRDRNRICGFAPTYLMLRYLGESGGRRVAYEQCAADHQDASLVSICGLLID